VFRRFGGLIVRQESLINKNELIKPISSLLSTKVEVGLRKKASSCMGAFALVLNEGQLQNLI